MNEYDDLITKSLQPDPAQSARVGFSVAVETNPDAYAEARRVARSTGVPVDTALNLSDEVKKQARVGAIDFDGLAKTAPATAALLADVEKAKIAHDDVESLSLIERVTRQFSGGALEAGGMSVAGTGRLLNVAQRSLAGWAGLLLPKPMAGGRPTLESLAGPMIGDDWQGVGTMAKNFARNDVMIPEAQRTFSDQVVGGLGQVAGQIAMLPIARGAGLYAQGADAVGEKIDKDNAPQWKKDVATLLGAGVTGVTEKWSLDILLGPMATPIKNQIAASLARIGIASAAEGAQEFTENTLQDVVRKALTNRDAEINLGQSAEEGRVGAAVGGIVRTIVEAGLHIKMRGDRAQQAERNTAVIAAMNELASANKVLQRDADTFEQFVEQASEGSPVTDVFINAQTLAQSGVAEQLATVSSSVAEQFQAALATGGDIRIPVGEYAARIAPTEYAQGLLDHLKTDPEGFSRIEAREFMQSQAELLQADVERALAEKQGDETFRASAEQVKATIKSQLDTVGRFTGSVNDAYATMVGNFYAVMGAKIGVSPQELFQRYPLKVAAEGVGGGQEFAQARNFSEFDKAVQGDLFPKDFATKRTTIKREIVVSSKGAKETIKLPNVDSTGKQITGTVQGLENFWNWYGNGPVDDKGRPILLYHSTNNDITEFETGLETTNNYGILGDVTTSRAGIFATPQRDFSQEYLREGSGQNVMPIFMAFQNPLDLRDGLSEADERALDAAGVNIRIFSSVQNDWELFDNDDDGNNAFVEALKTAGYDGAIIREDSPSGDTNGGETYIAFDKKQIKSKFNKGTYNPNTADILNQSPIPSIVEVDGVQRPTTNSNGKPIAQTEEGLRNFWRWFGDSKVVDAEGRPLVVYHGTDADFGEFSSNSLQLNEVGDYGAGFYFTSDSALAGGYAKKRGDGANIVPVYVALKKPFIVEIDDSKPQADQKFRPLVDRESAQAFTDQIKAQEHDGVIVKVLDTDYDGTVVDEYLEEIISFRPTQIKSATGNRGTFDPADANILNQGDRNRGSFNPATNTITLLKNADLSTFLHESGHFFLETQFDIASRIGTARTPGEQQILQDTNALLKWFGIADLAEWYNLDFEEKRSYHEKFARGFEAYLFEGKAPSIELQGLFQRFRAWLLNVYKELKNLNVELSDEVRGVFDRMLASNEEIKLAEQGRSMMPLFTSPDEAGMTPEEFAAYQALGTDATNEAIQDLQARGMRDMQYIQNARGRVIKRLQKEAKEKRAAVEMDVRREVMSQPIYRAWAFLTGKPGDRTDAQKAQDAARDEWKKDRADFEQKTREELRDKILAANSDVTGIKRGQLLAKNKRQIDIDIQQALLEWDRSRPQPETAPRPAEGETAGGNPFGRIGIDGLEDIGSPVEIINHLKAMKMTAKEGLHPDMVAEMFGFTSGDELVRRIAAAEAPKDEIAALTDVRMLEQYGELASQEAIERAADKAIHNDVRARMVATELNTLAKATGQRKVLASAAKEFAAAMIGRLKIRSIRPGQYANAEVRAAKAAEKASKSGDMQTAAAEKRNQLVNLYATRAAYDAQDEVETGLRYLKKFDGDGVRKGLSSDYTEQIDALLDRFDLRKGQSLKAIDRKKTLAEWIASQTEAGIEPDIPPGLVNEAFRKSYKDMTVEEFRGLIDTVKQIEHLGRLKKKLLTAKDQREYEAIRDGMVASIRENAGDRKAQTRTPDTTLGKALQKMRNFWASHIKSAMWARIMDGGKDGGPVWEYLIRPANERGDWETTMRAEATAKLSQILDPVFKLGGMQKKTFFPSINRSLTREARIAIALNAGNDGNLQRLLGGEGWTVAQVQPVLQSLTAEEWLVVQQIWDHFESYRPEIGAKEKRVYGKEPEWVQPVPFTMTTADGQQVNLRGGYYPIKYDPAASQRAEEHSDAESAKRQLQGAYTSATTRRSFTKSRAEEVSGRPLLYSLAGVYSGVNDVIHDLAWHEWLIDANRLLRSQSIDAAIREHYGPEVKAQFKKWAADIAEGEKAMTDAGDIAASYLRQSVSVAGLGFNVMSAAIQPIGLTNSIARVGAKWVGRGVSKYIANPIALTREVNGMSDFMANRARTRFRELNELRNQVEGQTKLKEFVGRYAYFLMMRFQQAVDVPTWWGAYEKAIAEGNNEERARDLADQSVIDAQGGGMLKDQAGIERTDAKGKLFTVFYSFMNTTLNLGVVNGMSERQAAKRIANYLLLFVVPPMLTYALKAALTPGDSGDDDPEKVAKKLLASQIDYLMGMMVYVREFSDVAKTLAGANDMGRDYQGPAGLRLIADAGKFVQQAGQGEFDDAFRKAAVNLIGDLFGLPSAQINRTITGTQALAEGETANPAAIGFGFQRPR